jgi:hypothetical protein
LKSAAASGSTTGSGPSSTSLFCQPVDDLLRVADPLALFSVKLRLERLDEAFHQRIGHAGTRRVTAPASHVVPIGFGVTLGGM